MPPLSPGGGGPGGQSPGQGAAQPAAWNRDTAVPPPGEQRLVPDHVLCVLRAGMTRAEIAAFQRAHRIALTTGGRRDIRLIGAQVFRFRITDGRDAGSVVAELVRDPRVLFAQPDYVYQLVESTPSPGAPPGAGPAQGPAPSASPTPDPAPPAAGTSAQYVVDKLQLREAHALALGDKVLIAIIDSAIDTRHPEITGSVVRQIDVLDDKDRSPHAHGTAMAGAIVSRAQLMGVAPRARLIAIRAFSARTSAMASGTTFQLTQAIDRAVTAGARIINMSFAGPPDPMLQRAIQAARDRGTVSVAAVGNAGPGSAPLYPAAYPSVIAVTATDANDRLFEGATRADYVALAAPGVDVLVPAPHAEYGFSTGTSVAAAHVSGVVALMLARRPNLNVESIRRALRAGVQPANPDEPASEFGAGVTDAYKSILAIEPGPPGPGSSVTPAMIGRPAASAH